ncbi:hypothetical protein [Paenibacillus illinoisensis]|uniref:Uncharacterized protein n=1 Tax=Paenibacillus illinoisensis TaxID=59845 RepID=A0A2W0CDS4_9BACL|nr:hypothetical protein [Paenibacillus illinoisensis]PYY30960.1 Uncharacterized protein PIL02S_00507 [Paenibacillus illinoisensis]
MIIKRIDIKLSVNNLVGGLAIVQFEEEDTELCFDFDVVIRSELLVIVGKRKEVPDNTITQLEHQLNMLFRNKKVPRTIGSYTFRAPAVKEAI